MTEAIQDRMDAELDAAEAEAIDTEDAVPAEDPTPQLIDVFGSYYVALHRLFSNISNGKSVKTPDANKTAELAAHYAFQCALTGVK